MSDELEQFEKDSPIFQLLVDKDKRIKQLERTLADIEHIADKRTVSGKLIALTIKYALKDKADEQV